MRAPEPIRTRAAGLELVPVPRDVAEAVVAGDLSAVAAGAGWPHADSLDGLRLALEHGPADGGAALGWFVVLEGVVVGDCGVHGGVDADGTVEIGYGLAGPSRGRGLGTEVCRALTAWLLDDPEVRRVVASAHAAGNPASRRVLEKAGFTYEGDAGDMAWYVRVQDP